LKEESAFQKLATSKKKGKEGHGEIEEGQAFQKEIVAMLEGEREVKPHVPDAWIDELKTKVGYDIPFNRHFYKYTPPRPLEEIKAEIKTIEQDILKLLTEVAG